MSLATSSVAVKVYENQRFFPITGWSKHLLPTDRAAWSTEDGSKQARKEDVVLPFGWKWVDDWKIEVTQSTDKEGFSYAIDFPRTTWSSSAGLTNFVRRRCWTRTMSVNDAASVSYQEILGDPLSPGGPSLSSASAQSNSNPNNNGHGQGSSFFQRYLALKDKSASENNGNNGYILEDGDPDPGNEGTSPQGAVVYENKLSAGASSSSSNSVPGNGNGNGKSGEENKTRVEICENQRYFPIAGWGSKMLPLIDQIGVMTMVRL